MAKSFLKQHSSEVRRMLIEGFLHTEISEHFDNQVTSKQVYDFNNWHKLVNLQDTYRKRVFQEGIPNRLNVSDEFGYWFAGFFDGEGSLIVSNSIRPNDGSKNRVVRIHLSQRADDVSVLKYAQHNLKCGILYDKIDRKFATPQCSLQVNTITDLAEIVVPLFDKYLLRSKKRVEYQFWRELAIERYVAALGGKTTTCSYTAYQDKVFEHNIKCINMIRHPFKNKAIRDYD